MEKKLKFSVIIPVYKDWERLKLCVKGLEQQTLTQSEFEILVVNNDEVDNSFQARYFPENMQLLHQPIPGSYSARNLAIEHANGEILAFTDSDCIPDKDWLKNAWSHFSDKNVDRIGGNITVFYKNEKKKTAAELYDSIFAFHQKELINKRKSSVTANLLVRKSAFFKVGFFDSTKLSGGDFYWNQQANKVGLSIKYANDVLVRHPARRTIRELAVKRRRVLGGANLPRTISGRLAMIPYFIASRLIKPIAQVVFTKRLSPSEKVKVSLVIFYLYFTTNKEFIRLAFGGKPVRD